MHPIRAAREAGLSQYVTGKPCPLGHVASRFVSSRQCVVCAGERKKKWANANRDHIQEYNGATYWDDPVFHRQRTRDYVAANREKILVKRRAIYRVDPIKATQWAKENKDRVRENSRNWDAANPEKRRAKCQNRRAIKIGNGGKHTAVDVTNIFEMQNRKCAYCRKKLGSKYHVDHIVALINGGTNDRRNLQITCQPCNNRKHSKDPIVFAQSLGMLL